VLPGLGLWKGICGTNNRRIKNMADHKRIDRKLEFEGKIVKFYSDTMLLPDGNTEVWDFIEHKGAAAIVPVKENGDVIMVRQYRNAPERYTLEIPAGALNPGEDRKTAAVRELEEETGYRAGKVGHLFDLYTTVAFCNELIGIYYTEELTPAKQHLDPDEFLNVEVHPLNELIEMIMQGKIQDAKTIAALLAYNTKKMQEKQS
jgi:ADP-ribose pyrophosphatase